jgi:transcriptional regulator with GAF, ATPase, and Fis domain
LKDRLKQENIYLRAETGAGYQHDKIIGDSEAIKKALVKARQVADTDTTVLITGETGTGKELFAQAIHDLSGRKDQLMVKLNCAALPPTLVEGELFGREKGAYTGAMTSQVGRFELANGSTIFLDEIGELTQDLQVKLLRVIEDGTYERLGSSKTIHTDVRIIAATNSDLQKMISEGRFREDLYYRLNVFPIRVPPLRERPSDVPQLAWTFIRELESRMGKRIQTIPEDVMVGLIGYPWPGNVRELRNVIEHAMILSPGPVLQAHLPEDKTAMDTEETQGMTLDEVNRRHILRALEQTDWRIQGKDGAAQLMGVKPNTLRSRMEKLGIKKSG